MRRVRRQEKQEQAPVFPCLTLRHDLAVTVYGRVVKHDDGLARNPQGEVVHESDEPVGVDALRGVKPVIDVVPARHAEDVQPPGLLAWYVHVLITEFPTVWHVPLCADMALIGKEQVY